MEIPKELAAQITPELIEGAQLSRSLRNFIAAAWHVVEPSPWVPSWHTDAIADHLEAVSKGQIEKIAFLVPPGTSKSSLVSVMWPLWEWASSPAERWLFQSYSEDLVLDHAVKSRNIVESDWFRARWPNVRLKQDQNQKGRFDTSAGGFRVSTTVGGAALGLHPTRIVWDDPNKRDAVNSPAELKYVNDSWDQTVSTRGYAVGVRKALVMQRLAENDAAGHILQREDDWVVIVLPMRYEPRRMVQTPLGWMDPRADSEKTGVDPVLLDPQRFPEKVLTAVERVLGSYGVAGQMQQRPAPLGGGLIQRKYLRFWQPKGQDLGPVIDPETLEPRLVVEAPEEYDQQIQSWDMSFKDEMLQVRKGNPPDPVSGLVLARRLASIYLLDRINKRMDAWDSAKAVLDMSRRFPEARVKLIEDKANGPAVRGFLRRMGVITQPVTPRGTKASRVAEAGADQKSKDARAMSMQAMIEAGEYFLPHPKLAPWIWAYVAELCGFPTYATDDDVDSTSQAFLYFERFIDTALVAAGEGIGALVGLPKTTDDIVRQQLKQLMDEELQDALVADGPQSYLDGPSSPWLN